MKNANTVPIMTAVEAVQLVKDHDMVAFCGAVSGITEATALNNALAERYRTTGSPRELSF